jgi:hypothetical protein
MQMNTLMKTLMILGLGASVASAAEPRVMNECLAVDAVARTVDASTMTVVAEAKWTCPPEIVGSGIAKMKVDGVPAGTAAAFDGFTPVRFTATVPQSLAPKVCVEVAGFDLNGDPTVSALQCVEANKLTVSLPEPIAPSTRRPPGRHVRR